MYLHRRISAGQCGQVGFESTQTVYSAIAGGFWGFE